MDHSDYFEEGMEEKAKNFEQMLKSGESFFYDNDELSRLIDYYLDFDQLKNESHAIAFGEELFPFESYRAKRAPSEAAVGPSCQGRRGSYARAAIARRMRLRSSMMRSR